MSVTIGNFPITDKYRISCDFKGDVNFDSLQSSIIWSLTVPGQQQDHNITFQMPNMIFTTYLANGNTSQWTIPLTGIGAKGYYYYKNGGRTIHLVVDYNSTTGKQSVWVDGYLIRERTVNTLVPLNATCKLETFAGPSYRLMSGTVTNVSLVTVQTPIVALPNPTPVYEPREFPLNYVPGSNNYTNVRDPLLQLETWRKPNFKFPIYMVAQAYNPRYLAGKTVTGPMTPDIVDKAVAIKDILYKKYGHQILCADNLHENLPFINNTASFERKMIEYAKANPAARNGVATVTGFGGIACNAPMSTFDGRRDTLEADLLTLKAVMGTRTIDDHIENNETLNQCKNLGQNTASELYRDRIRYTFSKFRALYPGMKSTEYDIFNEQIYDNAGTNGVIRLGIYEPQNQDALHTCQFYIRYPFNWPEWGGLNNFGIGGEIWDQVTGIPDFGASTADRGLGFLLRNQWQFKQAGYNNFSPFVSAGWAMDEEINLRPAQYMGLLKLAKVLGAKFFYAGYFTTSGTGLQNPKGYVWQLATPSYVEARFSAHRYIIEQGTLMNGDTFVEYYNPIVPKFLFKSGDKLCPVIARKYGNDEYLVVGAYMNLNNFKGQPMSKTVTINLDGTALTFICRRQGTVLYIKRNQDGSFSVTQLDKYDQPWHYDHITAKEVVVIPQELANCDAISVTAKIDKGKKKIKLTSCPTPVPC